MNQFLSRLSLAALTCTGLLLGGCGAPTHIEHQWQAPPEQHSSPYGAVLVVSLAEEEATRRRIESHLAEELREQGIEAFLSSDKVAQAADEPADVLQQKVADAAEAVNAEAVMVASLLREEVDVSRRQDAGFAGPVPQGAHYDTFNTYWSHQHQAMYAPHMGSVADTGRISAEGAVAGSPAMDQRSRIQIERVYVVETSLYDLKSGKPVWIAQSKTMHPDTAEEGIASYAAAVAGSLDQAGLLESSK